MSEGVIEAVAGDRRRVAAAAADVLHRLYRMWDGAEDWPDKTSDFLVRLDRPDSALHLAVTEDTSAGIPVGAAWVDLPANRPGRATLAVQVAPGYWGRGHGSRLLAWAEGIAQRAGRTEWRALGNYGPLIEGAPWVEAPDGGRVPQRAPAIRFWSGHGYTLARSERRQRLTLPLLHAPAADLPPGYRLLTWAGRPAQRWLDDVAVLWTCLNADVPRGSLRGHALTYRTDDVVRAFDENAAKGWSELTVAAEYDGHLVGYAWAYWTDSTPEAAFHQATLVLPEHRGKGIALAVKTAHALALPVHHPQIRRLYTWNSQSNQPMLDVNEALGFRPWGGGSTWQKLVEPH